MAKDSNKTVNDYGFVRVAAVVPRVNVADIDNNLSSIIEGVDKAVKAGARIVLVWQRTVAGRCRAGCCRLV